LQQIFLTSRSPEEYARQGENFEFPVPERCPNPACMVPIPPKKHGFYQRNCLDFNYRGRIIIRRYYCPYCGKTVSYLPSFCLPYYQYSLAIIYLILVSYFSANMSYSSILSHLIPDYGLDVKKGAEKMLCIVNNGFAKIQNFSTKFFEQCKRSFLSPLHDILALREGTCLI